MKSKFTKEFKEKAIKLSNEGVKAEKIFEDAGFDISNKQKHYASKTINDWKSGRNKHRNENTKEKSKKLEILKLKKKTEEKKKIQFLEAKIAYLEAEKDFLMNLPKKKQN